MDRPLLVLIGALALLALSILVRDGVLLLGGSLLCGLALLGIGEQAWRRWRRGIRLDRVPGAPLRTLGA